MPKIRIAGKYVLFSTTCVNGVKQICLEHLAAGNKKIQEENFVDAIRKEFGKEGKML